MAKAYLTRMPNRTSNPIIIVDDDLDDLELIREAYQQLKLDNELITFSQPWDLVEHLKGDIIAPFLILSDVNMPRINGLELRAAIIADCDIKFKSIPFIIWSTSATTKQIQAAYSLMIQGFFEKPSSFEKLKELLGKIISYWEDSHHP